MKFFRLEDDYLELFPESNIGVLVCEGIDNKVYDETKYADWLKESQEIAMKYVTEEVFTDNPVIREWRDAFYKFRTKKGARCSLEALLKRVKNGGDIRCLIPLAEMIQAELGGTIRKYILNKDNKQIELI